MGSVGNPVTAPGPDEPASIPLTKEEALRGQYSREKLQYILERFNEDGFIVLEDLVDVAHVDALAAAMHAETPQILANIKTFNHGVNSNILQCAPLKPELIFSDVYLNPFVIQIVNAYLGARPRWNFITGNNALAGTGGLRQPVHKDIRWKGHPTAPFYVIANVPLADFSPENGSTEFWLGSHKNTTTADQETATGRTCFVLPEKLEERRTVRPPIQARAKKGSITLRDLRLWHAGMPNPSGENRIMMALGYQARWYPNYTQRLKLPASMLNFFIHDDIEIMANFVSDEEVQENLHKDNFSFQPSI
ncbi:hypothetical protein GQ53DRAFT_714568 [Thozetella sp. PMI_491]|nr:hypothetical protein GQ53DRAFT_714568 [Thozetella sp. PMI_491]